MAIINGTSGNDNLVGTASADTINGLAGDDIIDGGDGNDTLDGGAGADTLIGGNGTDTASYGSATAAVTINLKTGVNTGDALGDTYTGIEKFSGSNFNDTFVASASADSLAGGGGTDTIDYSTSSAAVTVNLTAGTGSGGDAAGDTLTSFEKVIGSAFNDTLSSSTGSTTLQGGAGNDTYVVGAVTVSVVENSGEGTDEVQVSASSYTLSNNVENLTYTGTGTFTGTGNAQDNVLTGSSGNDTLIGGAGADTLIGGGGTDTASYTTAAAAISLNLKTGVHTGDALGDTFSSIEKYVGTAFNDTFVASSAADTIDGGAGTGDVVDYSTSSAGITLSLVSGAGAGSGGDAAGDVLTNVEKLIGTAYADTLATSTFNHVLQGGAGNDVYTIGNNSASVVENVGEGTDEVRTGLATFSIANYANVENLTYTGTAAFTGTGNDGDNIITGSTNNDTFIGGAGADQFVSGGGTDTISYAGATAGVTLNFATGVHSGDAAGDVLTGFTKFTGSSNGDRFVENIDAHILDGSGGVDFVDYSAATTGLSINLTTGVFTDIAAGDTLTNIEIIGGSAYADTFVGNASVNHFLGGAGADSFDGMGGSDTVSYTTSASGVTVSLATGTGSGGDAAGDTFTSIEIVNGSSFNDTLTGDANANIIAGGWGDDILSGGDGNDTIYGGWNSSAGVPPITTPSTTVQNDTINGGNGDDTLYSLEGSTGTVVNGDAGSDTIVIYQGTAYGGDGADTIRINASGASMYGGNDGDTLNFIASGYGYGGEGSDTYDADSTSGIAYIQDTGSTGTDIVLLNTPGSVMIQYRHEGNNLHVTTTSDTGWAYGAVLIDWFAGSNTIETFKNIDGTTFSGSYFV